MLSSRAHVKALDSRHFSADGRLGYWTPAQVERALLQWIPAKVTAAPESLKFRSAAEFPGLSLVVMWAPRRH